MHDQRAASGGLEFMPTLQQYHRVYELFLTFVYQVIVVLTEFFSGESLLFASLRSLPHHCCDM
jgi:hypothetical protein